MSLRAMLWAFDSAPTASALDKLVLLALADEADDTGGSCYPSVRRIAARTNLSVGAVRNHIQTLETDGLIEVDRPEVTGRGHHNRYQLDLTKGAPRDPFPADEKRAQTRADEPETRANARPETRLPVDPGPEQPISPTPAADAVDNQPVLELEIETVDDHHRASFEAWWAIVPRRVGKGTARKAFARALERVEYGRLMCETQRWADEAANVDRQYVAHPTTWLNRDGWDDEPDTPAQPPAPVDVRPPVPAYTPPTDKTDPRESLAHLRQVRGGGS